MSKAAHAEQREKTTLLLKSRGVDAALFSSPETVTWLTGFVPNIEMGQSPYSGGPALVWYEGGEFTLIVMEGELGDSCPTGISALTYIGYTHKTPFTGIEKLKDVMRGLLSRTSYLHGKTGCEKSHLPACLYELLLERDKPVALDGCFTPLRAVKTVEELEKLRASFSLVDAGHAATREAIQIGLREIDVWEIARSAVNRLAGMRVPLGNDCVVCYRDDNGGGLPGDLPLRPGDSLILDLGARYQGYWSDSCATYYPTAPTTEQVRIHNTVQDALDLAISLVEPGRPASEIDRKVRELIEKSGNPVYQHHTGHSVGTSFHEEPRITPYNHAPLLPNMVVMLEPGIYLPRQMAVRLEHAVLVTSSGCEIITRHSLCIS